MVQQPSQLSWEDGHPDGHLGSYHICGHTRCEENLCDDDERSMTQRRNPNHPPETKPGGSGPGQYPPATLLLKLFARQPLDDGLPLGQNRWKFNMFGDKPKELLKFIHIKIAMRV